MTAFDSARFQFLADALHGTGGFADGSYLVQYPREDSAKLARRKAIAWYANALRPAGQRFVGYLTKRPPQRQLSHPLLSAFAQDCTWQNDSLDVFWGGFMLEAKARGSMLLLVDRPAEADADRATPYLVAIAPERVTRYRLDARGQLAEVAFTDTAEIAGKATVVTRRYDAQGWAVLEGDKTLDAGTHDLGVCPILAFTEAGLFPHVGPFATVADLSKRLYNLRSELDEILRAQTFSLLAYQVPSAEQAMFNPGQVAETFSTEALLIYGAEAPQFIAPPDGPATIYQQVIAQVESLIRDAALYVDPPTSQQESGVALALRFQALNAALVAFARRMEDFERRMWDVVVRWLGIATPPAISWSKDYSLTDLKLEIEIAQNMAALGAPPAYQAEKLKQLMALDLSSLDPATLESLLLAADEPGQEANGEATP
ncbi:MAG: hypothetical protein P9F19_01450 [Candidatus Contendobacter sp.]|nr:hypothetical protein [Candidatus Contendobacter sp.]